MITRADIVERVGEWQLTEEVIEKDYVLGWLLWGIGTDPVLRTQWVFKASSLEHHRARLPTHPDSPTSAAKGSAFNRRQGVSIEPASIPGCELGVNLRHEPPAGIFLFRPRAEPSAAVMSAVTASSRSRMRPARDTLPVGCTNPISCRVLVFVEESAEEVASVHLRRASGRCQRP